VNPSDGDVADDPGQRRQQDRARDHDEGEQESEPTTRVHDVPVGKRSIGRASGRALQKGKRPV
jgi:hypothetical protein